MRRLHTADWKNRTAARLPGVLARILPDAKAFAMRVLGRHPNNFAEHRLRGLRRYGWAQAQLRASTVYPKQSKNPSAVR